MALNINNTPISIYFEVWYNVKLYLKESMQFLIYADNIERCVKGLNIRSDCEHFMLTTDSKVISSFCRCFGSNVLEVR